MDTHKYSAKDYNDFLAAFSLSIPPDFNFFHDALIPMAEKDPGRLAVAQRPALWPPAGHAAAGAPLPPFAL